MPADWNGTLLLYSHGYWPAAFPPQGIALTNSADTEAWLLDHGFALAGSSFRGVTGYQVAQGQEDQLALLDWFESTIGDPDVTIATGQSLGASIAVQLAERNPDRFDGVAAVCGAFDPQNTFAAGLDVTYAVRHLLLPGDEGAGIELVHPTSQADADADTGRLMAAVDAAMATDDGRARLALIASLNNISGWWSAHDPRPTDPDEVILAQAQWIRNAYVGGYAGPSARVDLEAKVGGNPSSNVGVDYRRQLARSAESADVRRAYRAAGLDLDADLATLGAGERIAADPAAVEFVMDTSVPRGRLSDPIVTLHSVGDGGAVPDQERWYADQLRRQGRGDLSRRLFVERGQHCSVSAADEVVALQSLLERIEGGRWPSTGPRRLNAAVAAFPPEYQVVTDLSTWPLERAPMPPAFVRWTPPRPLRPSR
jgi:pimeloyl-ACP methyl ester carboxylesterase